MNSELHLQYYNSHTLLMVNRSGEIRKLYTPFRVKCISGVNTITKDSWVYVDEVLTTNRDELHYMVFDMVVSYKHFKIPVFF